MSRKKLAFLIVEIHRDHLIACGDSLATPLSLQFPPQVVKDLEMMSQTALETLVHTFVVREKLESTSLIIILSQEVYFEKDIGKCDGEEQKKLVQQFVDTVPFTTTSEKVFQIRGSCRLVVINRTLFDSFKTAFEKEKFPVVAVVPELVLPGIGVKGTLSADSCRVIAKKLPALAEQSFLDRPERSEGSGGRTGQFFLKHRVMLIILFVILVGWGGTMTALMLRKPQLVSPAEMPIPTITIIPTAEPTEPVATPSASPETFSIHILNASRKAGLAAALSERLAPYGFTRVETANSQTISERTTIVFSPSVPDGIRKLMLRVIQESYPEAKVESDREQDADITITIGSS